MAYHHYTQSWRKSVRKLITIVCCFVTISALFGRVLAPIESETLDGASFLFPTEAVAESVGVIGLAMGTSRDNGEVQQEQLLEWHRYLTSAPDPFNRVKLYHIPVIDAPKFIQGIIKRGITKSYEDIIPLNQAALLFMKDPEKFAFDAGIPIDEDTTVVVLKDSTVFGYVKGSPTAQAVADFQDLYQRASQ
jgi:hypothetical protein